MLQAAVSNLPQIVLVLATSFALLGIVALVAAVFAWNHVKSFYQEHLGKLVVEVVQGVSMVATLGAGYAAIGNRPDWITPSIASAASLALWKVTQIVWDWRG